MNIKYKIAILFLSLALIASSCPDERPELVSPPSFSETVNLRFLNLSRNTSLSLGLDEIPTSDFVGKYQMTKAFNPSNDSAFISLYESNNQINKLEKVVKFTREINYIFVSTPNPKDYSRDTIFSFTNIGDIVVSEVEASVKFINLVADTNSRISFVSGCPGGEQISNSPLKYLDYTSADPQRAGDDFVFSVIRFFNDGEFDIIGTFKTNFQSFGEYSVIITGNENSNLELFVIDELDLQLNNLINVENVETQVAQLKHVNLSDFSDEIFVNSTQLLNNNSNMISDFRDISACQTASSDTFTNANDVEVLFSPEVNTDYIAVSYNTSGTINTNFRIIAPPVLSVNRSGKAVVRCLNLIDDNSSLNYSLGANSNYLNLKSNDTIRNYSSGLSLASKLGFEALSNPVVLNQGLLPVLVFNSQEPAEYKFSFNHYFEADKNYLIITYLNNNEIKYTVIEQEEVNKNVEEKNESSIINIINGDILSESHFISLSTVDGLLLNNANLAFGNTIATAIDNGNNSLDFSSLNYNFNSEIGKRYYIIKTENDVFEFENNRINTDLTSFQFRIANLSDVKIARIKTISGIDTTTRFNAVDKGTMSNYLSVNSQGRIFVICEDLEKEEIVFTSPEVNVTRRKIYTFFIVGNKEKGYRLITLQDY